MEMISVIVPVYNAESSLERCLHSLVTQTYKNLEIILINDGSQDSSLAICKKFQKHDSRIIVIDTQNQGVSKARNEGLRIAQGVFLGFVDSDDWVDEDMFEKLYTGIKTQETNCMAVVGVHAMGWGDYLDSICEEKDFASISATRALEEITKENGLRGYLWNKLFLNTGSLLDTASMVCEDLEFVVRYLIHFHDKTVHVLNTCTYHYIVVKNYKLFHLKYGFYKTYTEIATLDKILSYLDARHTSSIQDIKYKICTVCSSLLLYWYSLSPGEREVSEYSNHIPMIKQKFSQYYQDGSALSTKRERIKLVGLRYAPFLLIQILTFQEFLERSRKPRNSS